MNIEKISCLLIDIDGVIYNDSQPIPGARETVDYLQKKNIPFRFITNTTMKSRETLQKKLAGFGINVTKENIFTAAYAASQYIRNHGKTKCHLLIDEDARQEYEDFDLNSEKPDFVVVGDLGNKISFEILNTAFQKLFNGSELIALQKNRYWLSDIGYTLDAGAFVALLEYATDKEGILIGKPSKAFFETVLNDLGCDKDEALMIGDDIESDIKGAQSIGIKGILVQTGKFQQKDLERTDIKPWKTIGSIKDLIEFLI